MKRIGFLNLILLVLISLAFIELTPGGNCISYAADDLKIVELANPNLDLKPEIIPDLEQKIARRGCCSWHGGVCDCYLGRVVCCDGTFSPSCTCHHDSKKEVMNSKE